MNQFSNSLKIMFFGTSRFAEIILEKLCQSQHKPVFVVTTQDKPVGRKQISTSPPVKISAQKYNIPVLQSEKIRNLKFSLRECGRKIRNLKPHLGIVAAYGQIIPKDILDIPQCGFINIHPSLLPKYRGSSPIQQTILNGDEETGVSIILMDEKIDHGPIISRVITQNLKLNYEELTKKLADLGAELLIKTIPKLISGKINPRIQDDSKATFTKIIKKEDGLIDWKRPADYIERQIRAFNPWPGTFSKINGKTFKILKADIKKEGSFKNPGKIFLTQDKKMAVVCKKDYLVIEELQLEGAKRMNSQDFLRGHQNFIGKVFNN